MPIDDNTPPYLDAYRALRSVPTSPPDLPGPCVRAWCTEIHDRAHRDHRGEPESVADDGPTVTTTLVCPAGSPLEGGIELVAIGTDHRRSVVQLTPWDALALIRQLTDQIQTLWSDRG